MRWRLPSKLIFKFSWVLGALHFFTSIAQPLQAHPQMIRHGYTQCSLCHFSPQGGGILTDYGRGVGDSESFFTMDYEPATNSIWKFLTADGSIQHGVQARGMFLKNDRETVAFPMQMDYLNSIQPTSWMRIDSTVGYLPSRGRDRTESSKFFRQFVLRKAVLSLRPQENWEWTIGRDFLPVGLNIDNHSVTIRDRNRRNVTDFNTMSRVDFWTERFHLTPFGYLPSYQEQPNNQEWGGGLRGEYYWTDFFATGLSGLYGESQDVRRKLFNIFSRWGGEYGGLLFEYDFTYRTTLGQNKSFAQQTLYGQPFFTPWGWLEVSAVGEYLKVADPFAEEMYRLGPQVLMRWTHFLSMIGGARYERRDAVDEWVFFAQVFMNL